MFQIQCAVEGDPKSVEPFECEGEAGDYWPIRFAVDAFIAKRELRDGQRVRVTGVAILRLWKVHTRTLHPANGEPHALRYGEPQ